VSDRDERVDDLDDPIDAQDGRRKQTTRRALSLMDDGQARGRRSSIRHLLQLGAVTLVLALLGLLIWKIAFAESGAVLIADVRAGKRPAAPSFDLPLLWKRDETWPEELRPALGDGRVRLEELRGHPVVVNFWASWCVPCAKEAPVLAASARAHAGEVAFLGLDVQDFESDARRFLRRHDAPYVSVRDKGTRLYSVYGLTGIPETYYLDGRGRVVAHSIGELSRAELESGIAKAVRSAP
jgi:cytochrome c biogenesis protein CcmG/thiol:disulfide interchange protein DsbE